MTNKFYYNMHSNNCVSGVALRYQMYIWRPTFCQYLIVRRVSHVFDLNYMYMEMLTVLETCQMATITKVASNIKLNWYWIYNLKNFHNKEKEITYYKGYDFWLIQCVVWYLHLIKYIVYVPHWKSNLHESPWHCPSLSNICQCKSWSHGVKTLYTRSNLRKT